MDDYISREEAKQELLENATIINDRRFMKTCDAMAVLDLVPPANVRPVVLCRDCYAYRKDKYKELARAADLNPNEYCALLRVEMPEDGFCYYGTLAPTAART